MAKDPAPQPPKWLQRASSLLLIAAGAGSMARCVMNNTKIATVFAFHAAQTAPTVGAG